MKQGKINEGKGSSRGMSKNNYYNEIYSKAIEKHQITFDYMKKDAFKKSFNESIESIDKCIKSGGIIYTCGNGGSHCDAQHLTAELVVRFAKHRSPIASITLGENTAVVSAFSNDYTYENGLNREINALAKPKDLLIAISTSGNSKNILGALDAAKGIGMNWILLTSKMCSIKEDKGILIKWPFESTASVQQAHTFFIHMLCEIVEDKLIT